RPPAFSLRTIRRHRSSVSASDALEIALSNCSRTVSVTVSMFPPSTLQNCRLSLTGNTETSYAPFAYLLTGDGRGPDARDNANASTNPEPIPGNPSYTIVCNSAARHSKAAAT